MHFLDVCQLVGVEMPADGKTEAGEDFVFETSLKLPSGHGFADVYYENHFAIEYKTPDKYKDLNAAYAQLQRYREKLKNPPLLVVTDINNWEIHSNFPNTQKKVYRFRHDEIASDAETLSWLRAMFHAPERLHPGRNTEQVTKEAADAFQLIADNMRDWNAEPTRIAYFLTKLVFCLFAEDVGLLPSAGSDSPQGIFTYIVQEARGKPAVFKQYIQNLFVAMNEGGEVLMRDIPYFNGTLFNVVTVEDLQVQALNELAKAAKLNWESIEPSIFGTLFERSLDPGKRAQLGAHYTSRDDILLIIEPVLMQPLRYEWDSVQLEAAPIRERHDKARTGRAQTNARNQLLALRERILKRIRETTVLDPACGSGNFLYIALQSLMDLEKEVIQHPLWAGLQMATREVHPRQMYGIEINPIAHALASIVVWIGYIQWRINNGYGQEFAEPILEELEDNIVCKDAILPPVLPPIPPTGESRRGDSVSRPPEDALDTGVSAEGPYTAPARGVDWPAVDVIVGNPPFLGGKKQRRELGDEYIERLMSNYSNIHGEADFSTYWFEKSRQQIESGNAQRVGLLSTNSIRGVRSRLVLSRIKATGDIFMAWSDREWILDGAAVRISMVGFDDGSESVKTLDGVNVQSINPDLTGLIDISAARPLAENKGISFMGLSPTGDFPISNDLAQNMLDAEVKNSAVLRRYISGKDITSRDREKWIVDFTGLDLDQAQKYDLPMHYVLQSVKPYRDKHRNAKLRANWWHFEASRTGMVAALRCKSRQLMTSLTAKHRFFVWHSAEARAANSVVAIARDDDYMFGVLHSKPHIVWALHKSGWLGKGNDPRYTNTTTFETFPFPWPPGSEDAAHPAHIRISAAAKQLHEERDAWLNPPDKSEKQLKDRTLTNLYNALQVCRGLDDMRVKPDAGNFAPRLDELHRALDEAVCDAYGWEYAVLEDEEEILRRLLELNLERAG